MQHSSPPMGTDNGAEKPHNKTQWCILHTMYISALLVCAYYYVAVRVDPYSVPARQAIALFEASRGLSGPGAGAAGGAEDSAWDPVTLDYLRADPVNEIPPAAQPSLLSRLKARGLGADSDGNDENGVPAVTGDSPLSRRLLHEIYAFPQPLLQSPDDGAGGAGGEGAAASAGGSRGTSAHFGGTLYGSSGRRNPDICKDLRRVGGHSRYFAGGSPGGAGSDAPQQYEDGAWTVCFDKLDPEEIGRAHV